LTHFLALTRLRQEGGAKWNSFLDEHLIPLSISKGQEVLSQKVCCQIRMFFNTAAWTRDEVPIIGSQGKNHKLCDELSHSVTIGT
jgi:hypothetical protein